MQNLLGQRICSSIASGLSTAQKLVENRKLEDNGEEDGLDLALEENKEVQSILNESFITLKPLLINLNLDQQIQNLMQVLYFLRENWIEDGCIVFSQYYDTAYWVAQNLSKVFSNETVAVYGGAGKSGVFLSQVENC